MAGQAAGQEPGLLEKGRFDLVLELELACEDDTRRLAELLAHELAPTPLPIFLDGPLGTGKTTFCRHLVTSLEGGQWAEVSSPSFTLMNVYPTVPTVVHCDLYRLGPGARMPDEILDQLDQLDQMGRGNGNGPVLLCEWSQYLSPLDLPREYVQIFFDFLPDCGKDGRALALGALGDRARVFLERARALARKGAART